MYLAKQCSVPARNVWEDLLNVDLSSFGYNPRLDIFETKDLTVVEMEVPGFKNDELKIEFHENVLTIRGEKKRGEEVRERKFFHRERIHENFVRSFKLKDVASDDSLVASLKEGILRVELKRSEEKKPKTIQIVS